MARRLVLASGNRHKIKELADMVAESADPRIRALQVTAIGDLPGGPPPDVPETADTFVGNAVLKVDGFASWLQSVGAASGDIVLADDSGLCVDALDGGPGVFSARFAGPTATDEDNNAKLVAELQARGLDGSPAHYACVLALRYVDGRPFAFTLPDSRSVFLRNGCLCIEGRCSGRARTERRGTGGFGYDPFVWIDGDARTFAELSPTEKARRSHRGAAMRRLMAELPAMLD